ncbi:MAG: hypothetical protein KDA71_04460, partial [Planctomycetales bacterium]|nr:hypothetical protein [Planctomycetales bacterium]
MIEDSRIAAATQQTNSRFINNHLRLSVRVLSNSQAARMSIVDRLIARVKLGQGGATIDATDGEDGSAWLSVVGTFRVGTQQCRMFRVNAIADEAAGRSGTVVTNQG